MNSPIKYMSIGVSMLLAVGLSACDKPAPGAGPAENAGKKLDQSASDAGKKISDTAEKVGDKIEQQSARAGVAVDDTEITTKVKAAIFAEAGLRTLQISVVTEKGVVTLSGSVDTPENSARAKALAGAVADVREVVNHLVSK